MELARLDALAAALPAARWWPGARVLGHALGGVVSRGREVLVVGTPTAEPWHLVAHLSDGARLTSAAAPTLVRWRVPPGAPGHLAVGLDRLSGVRDEALLVVAPDGVPDSLLERVESARKAGALVLAMDAAGPDDPPAELLGLAHEAVTVQSGSVTAGWAGVPAEFELASHVVGAGAFERKVPTQRARRRTWRPAPR